MIPKTSIPLKSFLLVLIAICGLCRYSLGQNTTDLSISFVVTPPTFVEIGDVFSVQAIVNHEGNSSAVVGETVTATLELIDPYGNIIFKHVQSWDGFTNPAPAENRLDNTSTNIGQVNIQMPWSESQKWSIGADNTPYNNDDNNWSLVATVSSPSLEIDLTNNTTSPHSIYLHVPDLTVESNPQIRSRDPLTGQLTNTFLPGDRIRVDGILSNVGQAMTQPGVRFPVEARLFAGDLTESGTNNLISKALSLDTERILLPGSDGVTEPTILQGASIPFEISNLQLPDDASGTYSIQIIADTPEDEILINPQGDLIEELDESNNRHLFSFIVNPGTVDLRVVQNSFSGETGAFSGLDPVKLGFSLRNYGNVPVREEDNCTVVVALSEDDSFNTEDFILREFDLGGGALGANLRPNETINLNWIQQMPDNLEGDYYLLVRILETGATAEVFALNNTPSITLKSKNKGQINIIDYDENNESSSIINQMFDLEEQINVIIDTALEFNVPGILNEINTLNQAREELGLQLAYARKSPPRQRPDTSADGRWVTYELTDEQGNQQVYLANVFDQGISNRSALLISKSLTEDGGGNGSSLRPRISADGTTIVFHSRASDLVPSDKNGVEDIFVYFVNEDRLVRLINPVSGMEANGASFYPNLNSDGSIIAFESRASNLTTKGIAPGNYKQIHLWKRVSGQIDEIYTVTAGNLDSYQPSVSDLGNKIAFSSDATNLVNTDNNLLRDVFLYDEGSTNANKITLMSVTDMNETTEGGPSDQVQISGDGNYVVFRSKATNLVGQAGIANIVVESGGVGYFGNPSIQILDTQGVGEGAILTIREGGLDPYGQLIPDAIEIVSPGKNYQNPTVVLVADPSYPSPLQVAVLKAHLVNPEGEIYRAGTVNPHTSIIRISQSQDGVGGNMPSREPAISSDGMSIVFSTKSSNLLEHEISREDGAVLQNRPMQMAKAKAFLVGGIGEIEILQSGTGYNNGFLQITDYTGSGNGAIASYEVDTLGRISSITMISGGSDYDLENTFISVDNPGGGSGFQAGAIRMNQVYGLEGARVGGGKIHRVEMIEHGIGYGNPLSTSYRESIIMLEGDGVDTNIDGIADAKMDPSKIHVDSTGAIQLEQKFEIEVLSKSSLFGSTLTVADANHSVTFSFSNSSNPPFVIGTSGSLSDIRSEITDGIMSQWNSTQWKHPTPIFDGPQIEDNASGGNSFSIAALKGRVSTSSRSAFKIVQKSNMLFSGSGFTRATPVFITTPVIHGYSEIVSQTNVVDLANGRKMLASPDDQVTDDIYLFEEFATGEIVRERISKSSFGLPVNYRPSTLLTMPSNRFPTISGDGRHVYFSSDASDAGGLAFDYSNQRPTDNNNGRDIYHFDRKTKTLPTPILSVSLLYPNNSIAHKFAPNAQIPIVAQVNYSGNDLDRVELLVDGNASLVLDEFAPTIGTNRYTGAQQAPKQGTHTYQVIAFNSDGLAIGASAPVEISIDSSTNSLPPVVGLDALLFDSATISSSIPISITGTDEDDALVGVQYYVDGLPYGDEILRDTRSSSLLNSFASALSFSSTGVKSIFAIGRDAAGNYVSSAVENISVSSGTPNLSVSFIDGPTSLSLDPSQIQLESDPASGAITKIKLAIPVGSNFVSPPDVEILGNGSGATITAVVDQNQSSITYGMVEELTLISGGLGYDQNNTSLRIVPVIRSIGEGVPAELTLASNPDSILISRNADQTLKTGFGYITSPRIVIPPYSGFVQIPRAPLLADGTIDPATFPILTTGINPPIQDVFLVGGFNQSPIHFNFTVSNPQELESLTLVVDGQEEGLVTKEPFTFSWIPDEAKIYTVYAAARDFSGNVVMSQPNYVKVDSFSGGGITASFNSDSNSTSAIVNSTIFVSGEAISEFGIAEVEFFIDGKSQGKAFPNSGSNEFSKYLDLTGISSGQHTISFIARDFQGNQAGTFDKGFTNSLGKQSQTLVIYPASSKIEEKDVILRYPHSDTIFSPQSSIPVIVDFNVSSEIGESSLAAVTLDGKFIGYMDQHSVINSGSPQLDDYQSLRFTLSIPPSFTWVGKHKLQVVLLNAKNQTPFAMSDIIDFEISDLAQLTPQVSINDLPFDYITDTSTLLVSAKGNDLDGEFQGITFYLDGKPVNEEIQSTPLQKQTDESYFYYFEANSSGVFTFHATGRDNSGNIVASSPKTIMVTDGSTRSEVSNPQQIESFYLSGNKLDVGLDDLNGSIQYINLIEPIDFHFVGVPSIKVKGSGSGAVIYAILNDLGNLSGFEVINSGTNYSKENIQLEVVQVRRVIRMGTKAEITTRWLDVIVGGQNQWVQEDQINMYLRGQEFQRQQQALRIEQSDQNASTDPFFSSFFFSGFYSVVQDDGITYFDIKQRFDGTPLNGEGYVIAPKFTPVLEIEEGNGIRTIDRLPLDPPINGTSGLADFSVEWDQLIAKGEISGGFTRAPIYLSPTPTVDSENIDEVYLVVDGLISEENKVSNIVSQSVYPYVFKFIAEEIQSTSISFAVKDYSGNVFFTKPGKIQVENHFGSGIVASFSESNASSELSANIQIGSDNVFSVEAHSVYGIREVEFYIDGISVGYGTDLGDGRYTYLEDFEGYSLGDHLLSFVARDKSGNEAGTFDPSITNIEQFKHKKITVVPSLSNTPPSIQPYPESFNNVTPTVKFKRGVAATINMSVSTDNRVQPSRVYLLADGTKLRTVDGQYYVAFDSNSTLHQNGIFSFEFIPEIEGNFTLVPMVVDSSGQQRFSSKFIEMEVAENVSSAPEISMIYPTNDITITNFSRIRFVASASHADGSLVGVQFYVNGAKYGDFIYYPKDKPMENFSYTIELSPPYSSNVNIITASAVDVSGNENYASAVLLSVIPGNALIPEITLDPINISYDLNQSVFLSASVTDKSYSSSGIGVLDEVSFIVNGQVERTFDQPPYFWIWNPSTAGEYKIFVIAKDNEGNVAVSSESSTMIGRNNFDETPFLGSTNPSIIGQVRIYDGLQQTKVSASQRRIASSGVVEKTFKIEGLSTKFLSQLTEGQIVRFTNGSTISQKNYKILKITGDGSLEIEGTPTEVDKGMLNGWSNLQFVNVYRVGSLIPLQLNSSVNDDSYAATEFYVNGTLLERDVEWPFASNFIPEAEGNYSVAVVAESYSGVQSLYTERIEVLPKLGYLPDGSTLILPNLTRRGATTIGSELAMIADYEDLDSGMNRVEFYLNGDLLHIDREKPFYCTFKPTSDSIISSVDRAWEITAVGIDNDQNRIALSQEGFVASSVILPRSIIKLPTEGSEYSHKQQMNIRIDVSGTNIQKLLGREANINNPNLNLTPRQMNVLGNGEFICVAQETAWGTGIFLADWVCDQNLAGDSGQIEILGAIVMEDNLVNGQAFTPTVLSNVVTIKVTEPNLGGDPKATVNQTYKDLLGKSANEQEVNTAITENMEAQSTYLFENDDFLRWASYLSEREIFQNMIDAIAGYQIMIGQYPDYLKIREIMDTYSAIPNYGQDGSIDEDGDGFSLRQENLFLTNDQDPSDFPSSAFSMGSFVDDMLSSSEYTDIHGKVPPLTPPSNSPDRFTNYEKNRRDFVRIIYQNKYGMNPTIQQETQGSYRISVFDPDSQEAQRDQQLMMMQQLSMYSNFGFGGGNAGGGGGGGNINPFASLLGNTNNQNTQQVAPTFRNGEPAVLFVVNMIAEETINNMDMIWGAAPKRDYFKTAALISSFWQENSGVISDDLILQFHGQSTEQIISQLMRDSRYFDRFGGVSITRNAQTLEASPSWKFLEWLGYFNDDNFPWIYHSDLGWIYVHGPKEDEVWLYITGLGWFWTTEEIWSNRTPDWLLWLYEQENSRWVGYYIYEPVGKTLLLEGKTFWNPQSQRDFVYE